jgi:MFS family permease
MERYTRDLQYYKFCAYGFFKNLRFFEPFIVLFFLETGLSYMQIGIVYTIREVTRNIFEIPAGVFADAIGRRKTMISSFSLYIFSFVLYYLSRNITLIIPATVIFALADAFRTGTHKAMIFDYLAMKGWTGQKVHYYGHTRSWSQIGSAISSLAAAALVFFTGRYQLIFLFSAIPYLLGLLLMISYPAYLDGDRASRGLDRIRDRTLKIIRETLGYLKHRTILTGIINVSSYSGYYRAVKDYIQPVISSLALSIPLFIDLNDSKRTALLIGLVYFVIYILSSQAARRSGKFADRFTFLGRPLNLSLVAGLSLGVLAGVSFIAGIYWLAVLLFILIYLVENLRMPAGVSWFSENLSSDILATALSTESQGKTLFSAVIAMILGFLADRFGLGVAFAGSAALLLALVPLFTIRRRS